MLHDVFSVTKTHYVLEYIKYDTVLKESIVSEYLKRGISIRKLAEKRGVNMWTIRNWIYGAKRFRKMELVSQEEEKSNLIEVTPYLTQARKEIEPIEESIHININGFEIKTDADGLKAVMEVIRNVRNS
jgi:transposase-like protein